MGSRAPGEPQRWLGGLRCSPRAPAGTQPSPAPTGVRGGTARAWGGLPPQHPARGRNPGQYFFYIHAAFLLECGFADWVVPGMRVVSISPEVFYSWR